MDRYLEKMRRAAADKRVFAQCGRLPELKGRTRGLFHHHFRSGGLKNEIEDLAHSLLCAAYGEDRNDSSDQRPFRLRIEISSKMDADPSSKPRQKLFKDLIGGEEI